MERNNIPDSFERMLKEKADEFKMYPSARVWRSIYNNMHPGRRWPSLTISIVLITILLLVGYTNSTITDQPKTQIAIATKPLPVVITTPTNDQVISNTNSFVKIVKPHTNNPISPTVINPVISELTIANTSAIKVRPSQKSLISTVEFNRSNRHTSKTNFDNIPTAIRSSEKTELKKVLLRNDNYLKIEGSASIEKPSLDNNITATTKDEDGKFGWQVYAVPSVVYRNTSDNPTDNETKNIVAQKPSMGLEVGASMQYAVLKKLKLKTGLQLNYTNYNSPTSQNFDLDNANSLYPVMLNNETYQVSIPVGVEVKLVGKEKLHWDIGATIQPSYLIGGGNDYLISSGKTGYVKESFMRNNWNLNAGFETFITYKINGLTWQLGPQFRYQFTSTYNKSYTVNQNLANYGVKLGVSKVLK